MDAWMLSERFRQELTERISSMAPLQSAEPTASSRQSSVEDEDPLPLPPLKIGKAKRGTSKGTPSQPVGTEAGKEVKKTQPSAKKASKAQALERVTITEQAPAPAAASVASAKKSKVCINLKERYLWCLSELKLHHLKDGDAVGVQTCWPFLLAVDPIQYPSYYSVIATPMDMSTVERKVKGEKYPHLVNILRDFELIRDNAYTFNPGEHSAIPCLSLLICLSPPPPPPPCLSVGDLGKDIRYLADLTLCNFRFLLKQVALEILNCGDETFIQKHLPSESRDSILCSDDPLEPLSAEFYLPRFLTTKNSSSPFASSDGSAASQEVTEKPALSRRKSVSKQNSIKISAASSDNQLSNEEVGYLLSQDDQSFGMHGMGDGDAAFDYDDDPLYQQGGSVVRTASNKKASKGKRKKSNGHEEQMLESAPVPLVRLPSTGSSPMEQWEQDCYDLLKKLKRHEFLDLTKPNPKVFKADFFHPVIELFPDLAAEYLQEIKNPMDFQIIFDRLSCHGFLDAQDVYDKIILIFQNTIDFNEPHIHENDHSSDAEFARKMVIRCKHMIKFVQWLANEMLPNIDDTNELHPESLGDIRLSLRQQYREERMSILLSHPIDLHRECNNLLRKFENRKYAKDYLFFLHPVPIKDVHDYSVYVRHPMDFITVKEKLEKQRYATYGSFLKDLKLIFANAMVYNKVHMETDPISKSCYQSAVFLNEKLESWLHEEFSIDVAERILYNRIKADEGAVVEAQKKEIKEKFDQELNEFRRQEIARLKSSDLMFAADQMRRDFISGALEPGTNMNLLTPRSQPSERPPMFYEPEVVEVPPGASSSLGRLPPLDPLATPRGHQMGDSSAGSGPSSSELIRENVWAYWRAHGPVHEKNLRPPSPCDGMELVRSDSETRLSRSDSRDSSCDEAPRPHPPTAVAVTAPPPKGLETLSRTDPPAASDPLAPCGAGFTSFRMQPLRKKLRAPFSALFPPVPVAPPRGKRTSAPDFRSTPAVIPFLEDENFLSNSESSKPKTSSRAKRSREKDSAAPSPASETCEVFSDSQPKKKRRGAKDSAAETPSSLASKPPPRISSPPFQLKNLCTLFENSAPVASLRIPMADSEQIVVKYQTCNGICLVRILTPCSRPTDDPHASPGPGHDAIPSQPSPLEEQKSQTSSLPDLGRDTSLTLTSESSPAAVSAPCIDLTGASAVGHGADSRETTAVSGGGVNPLPKYHSTNSSNSLPSGLLLKPHSSQAVIAAKRESELDRIRKILLSTSRSDLELKFKEELVKKKLLGCFGTERGIGDEVRKRALSLMKPIPEGVARIDYSGAAIHVTYPIRPGTQIPATSSASGLRGSQIQLTFCSPAAREILSQLFGQSLPSRSLTQLCELASHGGSDFDCFSPDPQRDRAEYLACFRWETNSSGGQRSLRKWHQSPCGAACACRHISSLSSQQTLPPAHIKIRRHAVSIGGVGDQSFFSISGVLPVAAEEGGEGATQLQRHWSPRIHLPLQQISSNLFISSTCPEVSFLVREKTAADSHAASDLVEQRYLENWIMIVTEHHPQVSSSKYLFPRVDLAVK
jgi:hypothetical protein